MIYYLFDMVSSVPPFIWFRPRIISLYSGLSQLANTDHLSTVPILIERLTQAEKKIKELTFRVERLEHDLAHACMSLESSATFCSATPANASPDNTTDNSSESGKVTGDEGPKVNGHQHPTNGNGALPPPPQPSIDNFKFTSTPNPVFLSRGKLHYKALSSKGSISEQEETENFIKSKKQRVVPDELILQKKLLRKMTKTPVKAAKNGSDPAANQSIEEDDGSLSTLMKNALKRKFANVDVSTTLNDSHISEDTAEFSL